MLTPLIHSLIRTVVPGAVGAFAVVLADRFGLSVPDELLVEAIATLTVICMTAYYLLARLVERRWPSWSWLLGSPSRPIAYERETSSGAVTTFELTPRDR